MAVQAIGRHWKLLVCMLIMLAALSFFTAGAVYAHDSGKDSVDDCEIRWEDETKYNDSMNWAINKWEARKGDDNCVDLEPDKWYTIADLEFTDVYRDDVTWYGQYEHWVGTDDVYFNEYKVDQLTSNCAKRQVGLHELGHAHRFDDHSTRNNVMYKALNPNGPFKCYLGDHDKQDYIDEWGQP